jgi:hypothetical protein
VGSITLTIPTAGTQITAGLHSANYAALQALLNGGIDDVNIEDGSVTAAKLATLTKKAHFSVIYFANTGTGVPNAGWLDAVSFTLHARIVVPADYVSGDIAIKLNRRGAAAGTAKMVLDVSRYRDATALNSIVIGTVIDFTPGDVNTHTAIIYTLSAANFQAGDVIGVAITRDGAHASDTNAATISMDGLWIEYTGRV